VQASNDGLSADTPADSAKVSGVSVQAAIIPPDTSDTSCNPVRYQEKPLLSLVCTPDTSDTPQKINSEVTARFSGWLIHFNAGPSLMVTYSPGATHAEVLDCYPDAERAEPLPAIRAANRAATKSETAELRQLITAIYRDDTEEEQIEALDTALADPVGALTSYRAIAVERHLFLDDRRTCAQCSNLCNGVCSIARPGGPVSANLGYRPAHDLLQRCAGFSAR
jgi:hypothetical protein